MVYWDKHLICFPIFHIWKALLISYLLPGFACRYYFGFSDSCVSLAFQGASSDIIEPSLLTWCGRFSDFILYFSTWADHSRLTASEQSSIDEHKFQTSDAVTHTDACQVNQADATLANSFAASYLLLWRLSKHLHKIPLLRGKLPVYFIGTHFKKVILDNVLQKKK